MNNILNKLNIKLNDSWLTVSLAGKRVRFLTIRSRVWFTVLLQMYKWIISGTGCTQPREDNWVAIELRGNESN